MPRTSSSLKKTMLNAVEQYELNTWLEKNDINTANLRRSFTDVLPVARLLARFYPELVDLNYYPPRNSVQNKLYNWDCFNKRVLTRIGLPLNREQMTRVARSVPGSVDMLLYSVMRLQMVAERKARHDKRESSHDEDEPDNVREPQQQQPQERHHREDIGEGEDVNENQNDAADIQNAAGEAIGLKVTSDSETHMGSQPESDSTGMGMAESKDTFPMAKNLKQVPVTPVMRAGPSASKPTGSRGMTASAVMRPGRNKRPSLPSIETPQTSGRQRGEQVNEVPKPRTVLYSIYMQAFNQLQRKNAKLERFKQWSAHLENMLQLKCERIDELQQQVAIESLASPHRRLHSGHHHQRRSRLRKSKHRRANPMTE